MTKTYGVGVQKGQEKIPYGADRTYPAIMLIGAAGCGKSSLIKVTNEVFQKDGTSINLIDSRGYEMENGGEESFSNYYDEVVKKIEESQKANPLKGIHIIWCCISICSGRIQEYDIKILCQLRKDPELKKQTAVVLTKCDEDDENGSTAQQFKQIIRSEVGNSISVFEVSNDPECPLELKELVEWSAEQLDDGDLQETFAATSTVSLDKERKAVRKANTFRIGFCTGFCTALALCTTAAIFSGKCVKQPGTEMCGDGTNGQNNSSPDTSLLSEDAQLLPKNLETVESGAEAVCTEEL